MNKNNLNDIPDWLLEQLPYNHSWIDVGGKNMHVMEKGSGKGPGLINAGVYIVNTSIIQKISKKSP